MASRGFVFQLESVWGWQIGSVSFPLLLSLEELFSINCGYVGFLFLKYAGSVEQLRCDCGLLVHPGGLAGQEVSLCWGRGAVSSCLCSLDSSSSCSYCLASARPFVGAVCKV